MPIIGNKPRTFAIRRNHKNERCVEPGRTCGAWLVWLAGEEFLRVPDEAAEVNRQWAVLLGVAQHFVAENANVLLNLLVFALQDLASSHGRPDGLQGVGLQVVRLEAWVVKVIRKHGLHSMQKTLSAQIGLLELYKLFMCCCSSRKIAS